MEFKDILHIINKKNINYYLTNKSAKELYDTIFFNKKYKSKEINIITDSINSPMILSDRFTLTQLGNSFQPYILSYKSYKINIFVRFNGPILHKYFTYKNKFNIEKFDALLRKDIINKKLYYVYKFHYFFNKNNLKLKNKTT
jgi:hypothetical protein